MSRLLLCLWIVLLLATIGCLGADRGLTLSSATPVPSTHSDLRGIATATGTPSAATVSAADQVFGSIEVLPAAQQELLQVLPPLHFSSSSTIDMLRLSAGAGLPPATGSAALLQTGLLWVAEQQAVTKPAPAYAQLRISLMGFTTSASASHYLDNPLLLPKTLRDSAATPGPATLGPEAQLRQATDTVTRTDQPDTSFSGERRALLWHRGQLVLGVELAGDPGPVDAAALLALAGRVDQRAMAVPGYSSP